MMIISVFIIDQFTESDLNITLLGGHGSER
jgi:hypothetical protein